MHPGEQLGHGSAALRHYDAQMSPYGHQVKAPSPTELDRYFL